MSSESPDLSILARSKLHLSVGGKDSLHRWVLLKNSIIRSSSSQPTSPVVLDKTDANPPDEGDNEDEEVCCEEEADSFMFPDASKLNSCGGADVNASEAEWLDSLLETLGDEDEDFNGDHDVHVAILPADDDDDQPYSPLVSPMSSSDDLTNPQPAYYPTPIAVPYPVPYPPFHSPVIRSFELDSLNSTLNPHLTSYEDPLPYYDDMDDVEDLAVPDAIEDTSDDESDVISTPSLIRSSSNSSLVDPASIPLPVERRRPQLHIYIDTDDSFYHPFEFDPLPFREDRFPSYNHHVYQEC
jgi:hypothetical protein